MMHSLLRASVFALPLLLLPSLAAAADSLNGADTAWIMASTALVLFMTLPGLALFTAAWCAARTCSRC